MSWFWRSFLSPWNILLSLFTQTMANLELTRKWKRRWQKLQQQCYRSDKNWWCHPPFLFKMNLSGKMFIVFYLFTSGKYFIFKHLSTVYWYLSTCTYISGTFLEKFRGIAKEQWHLPGINQSLNYSYDMNLITMTIMDHIVFQCVVYQ